MVNKEKIEYKIEQALHSMDNHTTASPSPYLLTRIKARLQMGRKQNAWDKIYSIMSRPVIAFAAIVFILILNVWILTSYQGNDAMKFQAESGSDWQGYPTATTGIFYEVENNMEP